MKKPRINYGMQGLRSEKEKYSIFSLARNAFTHHENWAQAWKSPCLLYTSDAADE